MKPTPYSRTVLQRHRLADVLPLPMPLILHLDTTRACNFRCVFCPQSLPDFQRLVGKPVVLDNTLYAKVIDELQAWGKLRVLRIGMFGEPLMNPHFLDMLRLALDRNVAERIVIFTNGVFLDRAKAERLCSLAAEFETPIYVRFSIVSVFPDKHRRLTGSNVDIGRIRDNVADLKSMRDRTNAVKLSLCAKLIDSRSDENELFLETYRDLADDVEISAPGNWSGIHGTDFIAAIYDGPVVQRQLPYRKACSFPFYYLGLHADGAVTACTEDWCRSVRVGNAQTQTLREIWNGEPLQKMRLMLLDGKRNDIDICRNCGQIYKKDENDNIDSLTVDDWLARSEKKT